MSHYYLVPIFKAVSLIFALSAVFTGAQSIIDPQGFSRFFGLPLPHTPGPLVRVPGGGPGGGPGASPGDGPTPPDHALTLSYISLMGIRQLATGLTLLVFAFQNKWTEVATVLVIIGTVVAGTDGVYLGRAGKVELGTWHALPGAMIAGLAGVVLFAGD